MWQKRLNNGLITSAILFLIGLPLILQINFPQNDDWVYYRMVQNFMNGNFKLDPVSAPTFYFQGLLGALFSLVFGLSRLPVLTLLVSVISFYLLFKILSTSTKLGPNISIIVALMWFFNPLNIYSSLGFMTENYLILCVLASLHFFNLYVVDRKSVHFILFNLFMFFGLMTKQSALALAVSSPVYFLINKNWRHLRLQTAISTFLFAFYFFIFPKTTEMYEKPLQFHHLYDFEYLKQIVKAMIIYISAFCFPLLLFLFRGCDVIKRRKKLIVAIVVTTVSLVLYVLVFKDFKPNRLGWQEFFYLDNTLERQGFYPRGVMGTKFYFKGIYDLYKYWDIIAKFFAGFVMAGLLLSLKKLKSQAHVLMFFLVYFILMILAEKVYDRYLPPLFLSFILLMSLNFNPTFLNSRVRHFISASLTLSLAFLVFYSYQFSMDFVLINKYIWDRSFQIVKQEKTAPKLIKGTNAWKLSELNIEKNYLYDFTFDSTKVNEVYREQYDLIEKHRVDFPGSLFVDPYIYLYKKVI